MKSAGKSKATKKRGTKKRAAAKRKARGASKSPMTRDEAIEELSYHCGANPNIDDPRWQCGFLSMLRPYQGLRQETYDHLIRCVRSLVPHLGHDPVLDRRVVSSLWGICHLARMWGLHPEGMLRSNNLISDADLQTLEAWVEDLSYDVLMVLDGGEPEGPLREALDAAHPGPPSASGDATDRACWTARSISSRTASDRVGTPRRRAR